MLRACINEADEYHLSHHHLATGPERNPNITAPRVLVDLQRSAKLWSVQTGPEQQRLLPSLPLQVGSRVNSSETVLQRKELRHLFSCYKWKETSPSEHDKPMTLRTNQFGLYDLFNGIILSSLSDSGRMNRCWHQMRSRPALSSADCLIWKIIINFF